MDYATPQELFDALSAPFPPEDVSWRIGATKKDKTKGMALAYIDARVVADRLDAICGPDGWQCNYTPAGNLIVCNLGVRMPGYSAEYAEHAWVWKSDGAGHTDVEAEKGMLSDAFKRAAVRFGIGRYLYGMDSPWVMLEDDGRKIAESELKKLAEVHEKEARRVGWGGPADVAVYKFLAHIVPSFLTQPSDVVEFRKKNAGMIAQLRVAQRGHFEKMLDRIGEAA